MLALHSLQGRVLKSVELEYDSSGDGDNAGLIVIMKRVSKQEHTQGCCLKHLSPDDIFKLRATMASVTEREKSPSMYTGKIFRYYTILIL